MKLKILYAIGLSVFLAHATVAEIRTITLAHEVFVSNFTAPASNNGIVSFKPCRSCDRQNVAVNNATSYLVNRQNVTLAKFRQALHGVRDRDNEVVIVMHHLESDTVVSISVTL